MRIILLFTFLSLWWVSDDWKLVKDKNNIKVYTKNIEGEKLKSIKIKTEFDAPINELLAIINDVPKFNKWVKATIDSYVISGDNNEYSYYISTNMPYPVKDRQTAILAKWSQDPTTQVVTIDYQGIHDKTYNNKKMVTITDFKAVYILFPEGKNKTRIEYTLKVDPAGSLPAWIINMASTAGPYDTMIGLRKMLDSGKYDNAYIEGLILPTFN